MIMFVGCQLAGLISSSLYTLRAFGSYYELASVLYSNGITINLMMG